MNARTRDHIPLATDAGAESEAPLARTVASVHGAVDKAADAAEDAARKIKPAIDCVAEIAHQRVDRAADVVAPTVTWLNRQGDSPKASQRTAADDAGKYISAHPWKSVGIALAAGFFISRIIR